MAAQFEYDVVLSSGESTEWITLEKHPQYEALGKINGKTNTLILTLSPDSVGTGDVELLFEPLDKIYSDPSNLHSVPWSPGSVSMQTQVTLACPTAFKVNCTSGDIHLSARGI